MDTTTATPTTEPAKLTREQALEKYGDVRCSLREFHKGDIIFIGDCAPDGLSAIVEITIQAGDYDPEEVSYDQSDVWTMREDEDRCRVRIFEGPWLVYEAESRGVESSVDDEDPDGDV